jgi:nitrite reductase/ring-hydroxylating ferredoxin subunit
VFWIRIGTLADFPPGEVRVRHLLGRPVGVRCAADGGLSALELACRHQGADLSGVLGNGAIVTCPRHGWRYDLQTGDCLTRPEFPLRSVEVRREGESVFVRLPSRLGEAGEA